MPAPYALTASRPSQGPRPPGTPPPAVGPHVPFRYRLHRFCGQTTSRRFSGLSPSSPDPFNPTPAHTRPPVEGRDATLDCPPPGPSCAGRELRGGGAVTCITVPSPMHVPQAQGPSHGRHSRVLSEQTSDSSLILNLFNVFITKRPTSVT